MLVRIGKSMDTKDKGFTLIELLVVMIIIGILAAIAIPVFLSQRAKARDTATKADVSTVGKEMATYYVDQVGALSVGVAGGVATISTVLPVAVVTTVNLSDGTAFSNQTGSTATTWCVAFTNPDGSASKIWKFSAANGLEAGACT